MRTLKASVTMNLKSKVTTTDNTVETKIYTPGENDVLLGRGGTINRTEGNSRFRKLIKEHLDEYKSNSHRNNKSIVAKSIVRSIEEQGGRFLRKVTTGQSSFYWVPVKNKDTILDKVKQAFRDAAPSHEQHQPRYREELDLALKRTTTLPAKNSHQRSSAIGTAKAQNEQLVQATHQDDLAAHQHALRAVPAMGRSSQILQQDRTQLYMASHLSPFKMEGNGLRFGSGTPGSSGAEMGFGARGVIQTNGAAPVQQLTVDSRLKLLNRVSQGNGAQGSIARAPSCFGPPQSRLLAGNALNSAVDLNTCPRRLFLTPLSTPFQPNTPRDAAMLEHQKHHLAMSLLVNQTQPPANHCQDRYLRRSIEAPVGTSQLASLFGLQDTNTAAKSTVLNDRLALRLLLSRNPRETYTINTGTSRKSAGGSTLQN